MIEATAQNVVPSRNPPNEPSQSQMQVGAKLERQWSPSPHLPNRLQIIHEFLKLKPPRYDGVDPIVDPYQFLDQIERIKKMLGYIDNMLIELIGYQFDNVTHYWYIQHVGKRPVTTPPLN